MYVYMTKQLKLARLYYYKMPFFKHLPKVSFKKLTTYDVFVDNASNPPLHPSSGAILFAASGGFGVFHYQVFSFGGLDIIAHPLGGAFDVLEPKGSPNRGRSLVGTLETHPAEGSFNLEFLGSPQWFLENIPRIIGRRSHSKLP